MFHISDIKKYQRCHRLYYADLGENTFKESYLRNDESITELLKRFFHTGEAYEGQRGDGSSRFFENVEKYDCFFNARFEDGQMRVKIPFMMKMGTSYDVFFIQYGTSVKELDYSNLSISYQVLLNNGIDVNRILIIYFNGDYVYHNELDPYQLFLVTEYFKEKPIIELVGEHLVGYQSVIEEMKANNLETSPPLKTRNCRLKSECPHYRNCFPNEAAIPDDSILTLVSSRYKNAMLKDGIECLKDVDVGRLEGNRAQYAQIMASRNNGLFVDKLALKHWLSLIPRGNASYIDFEWDRYLVPPYEGMRPLDVVCFEFALYYNDENGELQNYTFIGTRDCRRKFVEAIIEHLPKSGPIFAYNAEGAECLRLKELGEVFPEYRKQLDDIVDRFVDLALPFVEGMVYDVRMAGNYTLKKLVSVVSDYSYRELDINDGMKAVYSWRSIDKGKLDDDAKVIADLREYCSLDAYGLLLVYKWLLTLIN